MREIYSEIDIGASSEAVWEILTDLDRHSQWNPFIDKIEGRFAIGAELDVCIRSDESGRYHFKTTIQEIEPQSKVRCFRRRLVSGLLDEQHIFLIEEMGSEEARLVHKQVVSGILVPLAWRRLKRMTIDGLRKMFKALKDVAEGKRIQVSTQSK